MLHGYRKVSRTGEGARLNLNQAPWADCPTPAGGGTCGFWFKDPWEVYGPVRQQRCWSSYPQLASQGHPEVGQTPSTANLGWLRQKAGRGSFRLLLEA